MRAWRDRWSTTSPVATARPPIDRSSTQATPRAKTSLRWQAHAAGPVSVHTPPPGERDEVKPATLARRIGKREKKPVCLKAWRERMASEAGQAVYALRQRIERINADRKNHGFGFLAVRGLIKAKAHALWHALANNSSPPTV